MSKQQLKQRLEELFTPSAGQPAQAEPAAPARPQTAPPSDAAVSGADWFRAAFEHIAVGLALVSPDGQFLHVNRAWCTLLGYSDVELKGMRFKDITHPDDVEVSLASLRRMLAGEMDGFRAEKRYLHQDGRSVWVDLSSTLVRDDGGQPLYFVTQIQDITGRKQSERDQLKFRLGLERSSDAIFITDLDGTIVYANPAFEQVYGYRPEEALGRTPRILKSGVSSPEVYQRFWATLLSGQTVSGELVNKTKDGRLVTIEGSNNPITGDDGSLVGFLSIHRDVTERRRADLALKESEERYRDLFDNAAELIQGVAPDGSFVYVNRAWRETLGYTDEDLSRLRLFDIIHPDSQAHCMALFRRIQAGDYLQRLEAKFVAKDGRVVLVAGSTSCSFKDGQPDVTRGVFHDITERERLVSDLERRAVQLHTAAEVSRAASSMLTLDELLPASVELIRERFGLYYAGLFLLDEQESSAVLRAGTGEAGRLMLARGHRLPIDAHSMIGWCVANQKARIALDVGQDAMHFDNPFLPETRSELALPLAARGRVIGAMTVQSAEVAAFDDQDIAALQTMADQVANAIANARLFEQSQRRVQELDTINRINQGLASQLELKTLLRLVVDHIQSVFSVSAAYVALYDSRTQMIDIPYMVEFGETLSVAPFRLGDGLTSVIIRDRRALLINRDTLNRAAELGAKIVGDAPARSYLGVPILAGDAVIGAIAIQDTEHEGRFGEAEERLLQTIAPSIGIAIQNARLFEQAQATLAETRRRAQREQLLNAIAGKIRSAVSVDDVLHIAAAELKQATRATRAVARLGPPAIGDDRAHADGEGA